jgi:succinate dehydrogenase / fumarate reductase cytochrome b subunit
MASSATAGLGVGTPSTFLDTTVGKKLVMAVTGFILFGFVIGHMLGNLQIYLGARALNEYSEFLHTMLHGQGLWIARAVLLVSVGLHIWAALSLMMVAKAARPVDYQVHGRRESTYASRTMRYSGLVVLAFIIFHLLHLTTGNLHPDFIKGQVYRNVVTGLSVVPVAIFYLIANLCLGFHLFHGAWSFMQTLGLNHPRYNRLRNRIAIGVAMLVVVGNLSFPIAVLSGMVR